MFEAFINWVKFDMNIVLQAKGAFFITLILAFIIAYLGVSLQFGVNNKALVEKHNGIILALDIKHDGIVEILKQRLLLKSEQMESYKERALKYDEKVISVVESDAIQLKEKTLHLVSNIRDFLKRYQKESQVISYNERQSMRKASTEEEKNMLWNKYVSASSRVSNNQKAEYDRRFKIDAILFRDELLSRLPKETEKKREDSFLYEHPTNPIGMGLIADDLERMGKLLK